MTYVDRLLILQEAMKACQEDVRELKKEAKAAGKEPSEIVRLAKYKAKGKEGALDDYEAHALYLSTLGWLDY
jgi:uncharacterized membrane protein (DUF106 family)